MSRWSKNNVVVPLDTLINKEKENTNRPIAARSCGTVGRWGKMGFTSTRTYALKALPPSSLSPAGQSPELGTTPTGAGQSITGNTTGIGSTTTGGGGGGCVVGDTSPISEAPVPKPKKFFKSRNTTAPLDLIRSQFMQHHMSHISYVSNSAETAAIASHQINNHNQPREGAVVASGGGLKIKIKKRSVERKQSISSVEKLDKEKRKKDKDDKKKDKDDKKKEKDDKKKEGKILKPETQPSRILGRSRKPVNYNEDDDSIPYRTTSLSSNTVPTNKQQSSIETITPENVDGEELLEKSTEELVPISVPNNNTITSSPQSSITHNNNNKSSSGMGSNSGVTTTTEHPPIVLRISKGTSRLISTDSEDQQNTSPGHQEHCDFSPPPPPIKNQSNKIISSSALSTSIVTSNVTEISTTEELLSVLSGEPTTIEPTITHTNNNNNNSPFIEQNNEINYGAKISPDKPPKERLKLIIKTDVLKKALAAERAEKAEKKKNKKHHHHHHHHHHSHKNITLKLTNLTDSSAIKFKTPSPQPGNDNYDLYKQLTISPSDRDFDSQSSILGSSSITSSKGTTTIGLSGSLPLAAIAVPEDSCVIRSRGSSDITSDLETSQHSSLVAPPSDIESRLESMMDNEDDGGGGGIIDNNITGIGDNSNVVNVNNERNNCNNKKDNIKIKLKLLTEEETTIAVQQQPLQEDILEILTGSVTEKENMKNNKKSNKKNVTIKKIVEKKNIPTVSPTLRVTRATRRGVIVTDDSQSEIIEEENIVKETNEQIEMEKPTIRSRRAANKKAPLIETPTEPIKEIQLIPVTPVKAKSKTAKTTIKQKTSTPDPIKEIINSSLDLLPVVIGKRKRGQKNVISNTELPEEAEQVAMNETLDSKESKIKETKQQIKIKEIKSSTEIKPTSPPPPVRARRGAAVKANAALSTNSPTKSIDNSAKESTVTKKNSSPLPPKRGRSTKNNNLKSLTDSEISLENTENNNLSQSDEISGITYTIESSKPIIVLTPVKSYGSRKRKSQQPQKEIQNDNESLITNESTKSIDLPGTITPVTTLNETSSSLLNLTPQTNKIDSSIDTTTPTSNTILSTTSSSQTTTTDENSSPPTKKEYKINKFKRAWYERDTKNNLENEKPHKLSNNIKIQSSEININTDDNTTTTANDDGDDDNEPVVKKSTSTKDKLINNYDNSKLINKIHINKINNIVVNNNNTENNENGELMKSTTTLKINNLTDQINDEPQNSTISTNNSVKLVISKKKGSIFKSRALIAEQGATTAGIEKKRHIYKHTWNAATKNPTEKMEFDDDDDDEENIKPIKNKIKNLQKNIGNNKEVTQNSTVDSIFDDFNDDENDDDDDDDDDNEPLISHKLNRIQRTVNSQNSSGGGGGSSGSGNCGKLYNDSTEQIIQTSVRCDKKAKEYYTVVRNVKAAHQIQEIGEYQEMDDDVEYILDALQPHNPISTRCLSALQLATKCMTPAFRMHVRAHGTVTKFFKALRDAKNDLSLGLCTAAIMFVLSQDTLNIDLDPDSLELMINLLEVDIVNDNNHPTSELTIFERNKIKVRELCEDIKSQGKGTHLNLDTITVGTLAMETLLSLTSKKAGDWFKEELRKLGGLEHIIKTICDCCHQISDYVVSWTEILLDKLRTIERCLRVLENVSQLNETNQKYILTYKKGHAINTLFKLYKLCDSEIALYPTTDLTPKDNPGVVLREALVPTLKVLINLTHPFNDKALGSSILGDRIGIFDTSFHILLQAPNYVPERCIFELSILVLLLLINLTMHTIPNRKLIMQSHAPSDFGNQFDKVPAIKALIEYFYRCEEQARMAEKNTDAILENPEKSKSQSQEEVDETVTKLLQKAGHHMEHTLQASYAGILIGHLISDNKDNEIVIRSYLKEKSFSDIVSVLEKYYNFMNLTASSEATVVSHIKSTKQIIDNFKQCDSHSNNTDTDNNISSIATTSSSNNRQEPTPSTSVSTRSTPRVYKTYSQR